MNKEKLKKYIKKYLCKDAIFNIELYDKVVYFSLNSFGNREVCNIEIPYKNRLDKKAIYTSIADLITNFDFSFRVEFTDTKDILKFIGIEK
jgi:hypothetical protein